MEDLKLYQGKRVLVTGHTGFKGAWLCTWLRRLGADVVGYSLEPPTVPSLFETLGLRDEITHHLADIRDATRLQEVMHLYRPEMVFHLAAQPLVRRAHRQPRETFDINVNGTLNVLEAVLDVESVRVLLCVTSDKCYANRDWEWGYRENDPLGGDEPYSASKACAELIAGAYGASFFQCTDRQLGLATVRAGNVIAGGDWADERLVPDCIRAFLSDESVELRNPHAVRPWQHVLEALAGYLALGGRLWQEPKKFAGAWNFGPGPENTCTVANLVDEVIRQWGGGRWHTSADAADAPRETRTLRLAIDKAVSQLPWRPLWNLTTTLQETLRWYRSHLPTSQCHSHEAVVPTADRSLRTRLETGIGSAPCRFRRWIASKLRGERERSGIKPPPSPKSEQPHEANTMPHL